TELSPETYDPSKNPHLAGPAVISDPYCDELHVRTDPQRLLLPDGRPSRRMRLLKRGFDEVSWRWKLKLLLSLDVFGSGIMFISASAFGSILAVGMMLPRKQPGPPVVTPQAPGRFGSLMKISRPFASKVCEKFPW